MANPRTKSALRTSLGAPAISDSSLPGQVILVMQGGGALGAFQAGVYEAMHEAGIEPDWVVGTSIGAVNGAIITGNSPQNRLPRLKEFWNLVASGSASSLPWNLLGSGNVLHNLSTVTQGIPGFFTPNPRSWFGLHSPLGISDASYYSTAPLRQTLGDLVDFNRINKEEGTRLTLGAVNVNSGRMRYFDSRDHAVGVDHVMASGALPPAFPAVMIDGEPYWDGGICSNTPIEVVMDDNPRHDSVIFAAQLWQPTSDTPQSIQQVMGRMKDIQYASRTADHTVLQQQLHHLRHVVRELGRRLPESDRAKAEVKDLIDWGCRTVMHVLSLQAPALKDEDQTKDIDFTPDGISARWQAGYKSAQQKIAEAPWQAAVAPEDGIVVHN